MIATAETPPRSSYSGAMIAMHWLTALVIATVFVTIEIRGYYPRGSEMRDFLIYSHKSLGMLVLLLVLIRINLIGRKSTPPIVPAPPAWQNMLARLLHLTLYAAMIAMPILGWLMTSAKGRPIPFFGLTVAPIIGPDKELGHTLEEIHEFIGNALYYVIGLHAAAALIHHYLLKDNTLLRMVRPE